MLQHILYFQYPYLSYWGGTAAISLEHEISLDYKSYVLKKIKRILLPYVIATCGYVLFENGKLDFSYLMVKILTFSEGSLGHMYYLVFYLELTLIAPVLVRIYKVCEKNEFMQMVLLVCSLILCLQIIRIVISSCQREGICLEEIIFSYLIWEYIYIFTLEY